MAKKKILVLGASLYYKKVISSIKELNYIVLAVDREPTSPGFDYADKYAVIDIVDREKVLEFAIENEIDGIMPVNDFGVRTAFYVSQKLNLIGPNLLTGICGCDKALMRDIWKHEGLPQPNYLLFNSNTPIDYIIETIGFPMVIKPTDCGGAGRGISIAEDKDGLLFSIQHAKGFVKNDRYIAEEFIEGTEVTVDSLVYRNQVYPLAASDKIKPESQFRVATSLNFPCKFDPIIQKKIFDIVTNATLALGVSYGATHAELIVNEDSQDIKLVEIGIRGGGGHLFNTIIEQVTGINAPQELAKILCGDVPSLNHKQQMSSVYRFFNPGKTGIIRGISYGDDLLKKDFLIDFAITAKIGDYYQGLIDSMHRVGFAVVIGRNRNEAITNADFVENNVFFDIV
jgi:biotin carboxylase